MQFTYSDGGRKEAGYSGYASDCVTRSIAIATGLSYQTIYDGINKVAQRERTSKRKAGKSSARTGVYKQTIRRYMEQLGWTWIPTMFVGQGCRVHLRTDELPTGKLIVNLSKHTTAVIDGVIHDTHDPSRNGTRCVYGYYIKK